MGAHKVSAFHPFIFQKSGKSTIIRNLAVPRHFVAYLVFISSIRVNPGPRNKGPTSLLALKIRTPVANTGKLRSIGQVPVILCTLHVLIKVFSIAISSSKWSQTPDRCNAFSHVLLFKNIFMDEL